MKRYAPSFLLSLLLLLSLTACGGTPGGVSSTEIHYFEPEASNDAILAVVPDNGGSNSSHSSPDTDQNLPDDSQIPGNEDPDAGQELGNSSQGKSDEGNKTVDEDGWYSSKEEVALYIHLYGELPGNYVTKDEAEDAGWNGGNVERYTGEGTAIGGSRFGNREGLLPKERGRTYTECDIDTVGENSRGAKRIVFSNDGLVYYTDDHYESFELLYGEP